MDLRIAVDLAVRLQPRTNRSKPSMDGARTFVLTVFTGLYQ